MRSSFLLPLSFAQVLPHHSSESEEPVPQRLKTLKLWAKRNPSLLYIDYKPRVCWPHFQKVPNRLGCICMVNLTTAYWVGEQRRMMISLFEGLYFLTFWGEHMNILLGKSFCFIKKATVLSSPNTTCQNSFSEDSKQHLHSPYKAPKRQTKEGCLERSPWGVSWAYLQRLVTGVVVSGKSMGKPPNCPIRVFT